MEVRVKELYGLSVEHERAECDYFLFKELT